MNSQKEQFDLDRLKAISIVEVARRLGDSLKREGVIEKTTCPWHKDTRPSLTLYHRKDENHCYCFSCPMAYTSASVLRVLPKMTSPRARSRTSARWLPTVWRRRWISLRRRRIPRRRCTSRRSLRSRTGSPSSWLLPDASFLNESTPPDSFPDGVLFLHQEIWIVSEPLRDDLDMAPVYADEAFFFQFVQTAQQ